jgi:protein-S-isoprenylcysteine O-methyltransferase Ste14
MHAMGGSWDLQEKPLWSFVVTAAALAPFIIIGLHAVQMFAVHGEGTPIPLDSTKRLVASGLYAYVRNSMQLCSAASFIIIGVFLQNFWVSMAAVMAVIFVLGMVRWHHRNDLEVRFPKGWNEYREAVPEWLPTWRPFIAHRSAFTCPAGSRYAAWLAKRVTGLDLATGPLTYKDGNSGVVISGAPAWLYPLFHVNVATGFAAAALLLALVPFQKT